MLENVESNDNGILYLSFNQDNSCFTCGMKNGFFICDSNPFRHRFQRGFYINKYIIEY